MELHKDQNGHMRLGLQVGKLMKSWSLRVIEATQDSNNKNLRTDILSFLKNRESVHVNLSLTWGKLIEKKQNELQLLHY